MLWAYTIHPLEKKSDHRGWSGHIPNTSDSVPSFACRGCPRNVHVSNRAKLGVTFTQASHLHIVGQLRLIGELTVRSLTDPFKKKKLLIDASGRNKNEKRTVIVSRICEFVIKTIFASTLIFKVTDSIFFFN